MMAASKDGDHRKKTRKTRLDRISSLPDEVLSHILSLLPTKCAVGTSILSNRWKYLWTSITSFDLEGPPTRKVSQVVDFTIFVDKIFRSCTSSQIQKFRLHVSWQDKTRVSAWINEALKRDAKEVDIDVHDLPLSLFSCKTVSVLTFSASNWDDKNTVSFDLPCLQVLHIKWNNHYRKYIVSFDLPCLKVLDIKPGSYLNGSLEKLISSCSALEDLTLAGSPSDENFMISSPALKNLQLQLSNTKGPFTLSVKAPNVENIHFAASYIKHWRIEGDFSSLVKASMNIGSLSRCRRKGGIPQCFTLPKFHNMTSLEVVTSENRFWALLPKLLRSSPSLENLSLEQRDIWNSYYEYAWVEPKSIPKCFVFHLAVIKIKGFKGRTQELQLIQYCLGNAKVLQSLSIDCRGLTQVEETQFCGQLLKLSRASGSCQIQFDGDVISNL